MGNCMTNASIGAISTRSTRSKRRHSAPLQDDAPTIESSSLTGIPTAGTTTPSACSPIKQQEINLNSPPEISPLKNDDSSSCSSYNSNDTIEQQREEGQQKLRDLVISGASSGTIDWKSIISLAEDLHRKEQRLLNSYRTYHSKSNGHEYTSMGHWRNISRKQAFFELRTRRKENARRKKLESVGSFSVNLLLYGADECTNYCGDQDYDLDPVDENEIDVYEEDEVESVSSQSKPQDNQSTLQPICKKHVQSPTPNVVEGSFLAATSMYSTEFDEDESSSNSDSSESTISFSGIEMEKIQSWDDDDGLITIHEDASVSLW
jgi:hypothetical protein